MQSSHYNQMFEKVWDFNIYNAFMVTSPAFCVELHGLMATLYDCTSRYTTPTWGMAKYL